MRHLAVGLNFADTYFRSGLYPAALPAGMGVEGAGVVEAVGAGVTDFAEGDRVTYTGSPLGAYSTERVMSADHLIKLPDTISFDTAAAMTMRGLTTSYLLRRIAPGLKSGDTVLLHAAAGGVGLHLHAVGCACWASRSSARVSTDAKAAVAQAHGCEHTIVYTREDVATRVREITDGAGVPVVYDSIGRTTYQSSIDSLARRGLLVCFGTASGQVPPINAMELAMKGSLYVTRPALADYIADKDERAALAGELFDHVGCRADPGRDQPALRPRRRRAGAPRPRVRSQHRLVGLRPGVRGLGPAHPTTVTRPEHPGEPAMTQTIDRIPVPETDSGAIEVHRLTSFIGAELRNVSLADAANDPAVFAEIKDLLLQHKVLFFRDQDISRADHVKLAERFGPLEDHPVAGQRPGAPGPGPDLQGPRQPGRAVRERLPLRRDLARGAADGLGAALRRGPGRRRRHDLGGHGRRRTSACPSTSRPRSPTCAPGTASSRPSARACRSRSASRSRSRFPDAEHPVVRTHPETGEKVLFVNAFTTHFTNFHTAENVRYGFDYSPGGSELLNYLIRQASIPEYQVRWRWTNEQLRDLGQPLHPALRRPGLLPRRPQDGARRHRRRADLLNPRHPPNPLGHLSQRDKQTVTIRTATEDVRPYR